MKRGFTLVELSIVLVIIGLLIGGILVAQSLIDSTKVSSTVSQIQQFDAAAMVFKDKFRDLPGDAKGFGGDGDGAIEESSDRVHVFACEIANFWQNLKPDEFVSSPCHQNRPALTSGATKTVPEAKMGVGKSFFIAAGLGNGSGGQFVDKSDLRNYYGILHPTQTKETGTFGSYYFSRTTSANSAAKPTELLALDKKMDDGLANSGDVLSGAIGNGFGQGVGGMITTPLATCSSAVTYEVENNSYECTPLIRIGAQVGQVQ